MSAGSSWWWPSRTRPRTCPRLGSPRGFRASRVRPGGRDPGRDDRDRRGLAHDADADPRVRRDADDRDRHRPRLRGGDQDRRRLQALEAADRRPPALELDGDRVGARGDLRRVRAHAARELAGQRLRRRRHRDPRRRAVPDRHRHADTRVPEEHARARARHDRPHGAAAQDRRRAAGTVGGLRARRDLGRQRRADRRRPDPAVQAHARGGWWARTCSTRRSCSGRPGSHT